MQVQLLGYEFVNYKKKGTGEQKSGLSIYYAGVNPKVKGLMTADCWIDEYRVPDLYQEVRTLLEAQDFKRPVAAEMDFQTVIGSRYPELVSVKLLPSQKDA